jgi:hypothetical protein
VDSGDKRFGSQGDDVRSTSQKLSIIDHPLDSFIKAAGRYVKYETRTSSARFKTLSTTVESDSYCEQLFHIQVLEKVLEFIEICLLLYEEDKRIYRSWRFTPKKDTKILKDIDVKTGQLRVVHD